MRSKSVYPLVFFFVTAGLSGCPEDKDEDETLLGKDLQSSGEEEQGQGPFEDWRTIATIEPAALSSTDASLGEIAFDWYGTLESPKLTVGYEIYEDFQETKPDGSTLYGTRKSFGVWQRYTGGETRFLDDGLPEDNINECAFSFEDGTPVVAFTAYNGNDSMGNDMDLRVMKHTGSGQGWHDASSESVLLTGYDIEDVAVTSFNAHIFVAFAQGFDQEPSIYHLSSGNAWQVYAEKFVQTGAFFNLGYTGSEIVAAFVDSRNGDRPSVARVSTGQSQTLDDAGAFDNLAANQIRVPMALDASDPVIAFHERDGSELKASVFKFQSGWNQVGQAQFWPGKSVDVATEGSKIYALVLTRKSDWGDGDETAGRLTVLTFGSDGWTPVGSSYFHAGGDVGDARLAIIESVPFVLLTQYSQQTQKWALKVLAYRP